MNLASARFTLRLNVSDLELPQLGPTIEHRHLFSQMSNQYFEVHPRIVPVRVSQETKKLIRTDLFAWFIQSLSILRQSQIR